MLARKKAKTFSRPMRFVGERVYPADSYFVLLEPEWDGEASLEELAFKEQPPIESWEKEDR